MKVHMSIFVQDRWTAEKNQEDITEGFYIEDEPFFLDGPITRQVAILDFDPDSGALLPGAVFRPPAKGNKTGRYLIKDENNLAARDINQVCVYGAVYKAMKMFRSSDALGRELVWGFGAPQLLVIPQAGRWTNAFYERDSHSLQFFFFNNPHKQDQIIYACQSRDIVTHEAGHAILDGIAPSLYDALTPQSLALHEAVADLVAILAAFDSRHLRSRVLKPPRGSIENSTDFSTIAEEFGSALDNTGLAGYLRNLYNDKTLDPNDTSLDPAGKPNRVQRAEPHDLSEVLSGALYAVMVKMHSARRTALAIEDNTSEFSASGKALAVSAGQFRSMILRALDYLPSAEVSFADYGRAILAADQALYPARSDAREWLKDEFVRRKIVSDRTALEVRTDYEDEAVKDLDLEALKESDWVAYKFADQHRKLLNIPENVTFKVEPRLDVTKGYHPDEPPPIRECLFKVSWTMTEPTELGGIFPRNRRFTVGTTLVIDWNTKRVRALLTSERGRSDEAMEQTADRSAFLRRMAEEGVLRPASNLKGPDGHNLLSAVGFSETDKAMKVCGTGKMLHVIERR